MKVSVITINYNNAKGLEKTIQSVIDQTYKEYEYIVIDGGSTDGSVEIIKKYEDKISFWVSEPDEGIYNAMNKGVKHATGEYVNFMNSGDCYHSNNVLAEIMPFLDKDIVAGKCLLAGTNMSFIYFNREITMLDLITDTINHQATFIKTELLKEYPYEERFQLLADWAFTVKKIIIENKSFRSLDYIIADYDGTGVSSLFEEKRISEKINYLQEVLPPRIFSDYMSFSKMRTSPLFPIIAKIGTKHYKLQRIMATFLNKF